MQRSRRGFTLIELVITLLIGTILTSIALFNFGSARGGYAVRGARTTFATLHARARAQAIEGGTRVILTVDPAGDSAFLVRDGTVLETIRFGDELNVDLRTGSGSSLRICMNARGYADTGCSNFTSSSRIEFWSDSDSAGVSILALGQLVY